MDRIATFRSFISRTPSDPFPRYGLAMELKTRGQLDDAWTAFSELIQGFPDYVPTYLMAGGALVALGRKAEAAGVSPAGLEDGSGRGGQPGRRRPPAPPAGGEAARRPPGNAMKPTAGTPAPPLSLA